MWISSTGLVDSIDVRSTFVGWHSRNNWKYFPWISITYHHVVTQAVDGMTQGVFARHLLIVIEKLNGGLIRFLIGCVHIVRWEPEGCYCRSTMFRGEPKGRYCHRLCTAIVPFWFSMEHLWAAVTPFWLSTGDMYAIQKLMGMLTPWRGGGGRERGRGRRGGGPRSGRIKCHIDKCILACRQKWSAIL